MKELPKKYKHQETEKKWQGYWEENKTYAWDSSKSRDENFVIDTPPPTVSGLLHMGHIFSYTQADFVARYMRMKGDNVFYPMGFDDNGLPTERLVEKAKKVRANQMDRAEFITLCDEVAEGAREEYRRLFKSSALSVDWDQEYHTNSQQCRKLSQMSFLDLYEKDEVYRTLEPTLWDPIDQTALAQADIEDKDLPSQMSDITFTLEDGTNIEIATTRPELLPSCVALFCHPDDKRWTKYVGKKAYTPLFGVEVPILEDDQVEIEKGTGLVMCCTFGDQTDVDWWKKHDLPIRSILSPYGKLEFLVMDNMGEPSIDFWGHDIGNSKYQRSLNSNNTKDINETIKYCDLLDNKKIKEARELILKTLESEGLLVKSEDIEHTVKCAERSGAPLEILVTPQWFVKVMDKKEALLAKAAECNWYPGHMKIRMDQWIEGLSWDWCISRQRYSGVPFPVWHKYKDEAASLPNGVIVASADELPVDPTSTLPKGYKKVRDCEEIGRWEVIEESTGNTIYIEPDTDIMDTWATSSISPQLSSHGITGDLTLDADRHSKLFPADLRPQAHEIIRTWAFYTIVKAHLHEQVIPWKNLMISGWCLASDKTKMSKSKGNVVTPVDLIEEKGADVVRYWSSTSRLGTDTAFSEDVLKIGKKLVNKIWNASKFAAIQLENLDGKPTTAKGDVESGVIFETLDRWVLTRLSRAISKATEEFDKFEYCNARNAIEDFFWNDFCDNYLEMIKGRAYNEDGSNDKGQQSAVYTVYHILEAVLRLFAPITPHVTEELYSHIFDDKHAEIGSIHSVGTWPDASFFPIDEEAEKSGKAAREILDVVRKKKAEDNKSLKWPVEELVISSKEGGAALTECFFSDLANVTNATSVSYSDNVDSTAVTSEDGQHSVLVSLAAESDAA